MYIYTVSTLNYNEKCSLTNFKCKKVTKKNNVPTSEEQNNIFKL